MKTIAASMILAWMAASTPLIATAGIAPNTGASAMSQSGAKIAPAKKTQDESTENQDTEKGRNQ